MKKLIYAVAIIVLLVAGYYLYIYWALGNDSVAQPPATESGTITTSTIQAESGSATEPDTSSTTAGTSSLKFGEPVSMAGVTATVSEILEDSRCPLDVQCIQAGTVRIKVDITTPVANGSRNFELGEPISQGGYTVTLTQVTPAPNSTVQLEDADYTFYFSVDM